MFKDVQWEIGKAAKAVKDVTDPATGDGYITVNFSIQKNIPVSKRDRARFTSSESQYDSLYLQLIEGVTAELCGKTYARLQLALNSSEDLQTLRMKIKEVIE